MPPVPALSADANADATATQLLPLPLQLLAAWLKEHFANRLRQDLAARYFAPYTNSEGKPKKGGYTPTSAGLTISDLEDHVLGKQAYGCYLMDPKTDGTVRAAVVDLDDKKKELTWLELCQEASRVESCLTELGLLPFAVRSGSGHGVHLWLLWAHPQAAYAVRSALSAAVLRAAVTCYIDIFPAQDKLAGGVGNLVALPFGRLSRPILSLRQGTVAENLEHWQPVSPGLSAPLAGAVLPSWVDADELKSDAGKGLTQIGQDAAQFGQVAPSHLAEALSFIGAEDYDTWKRISLALKVAVKNGQLSEEAAFKVWDDWSRTSPEKYDAKANEQEWRRHFKPRDGGVTLGTIWHEAIKGGWSRPTSMAAHEPTPEPLTIKNEKVVTIRRSVPVKVATKYNPREAEYYDRVLRWRRKEGSKEIQTINSDHFQVFDGGKLYICKEKWDEALKRWCLEHRTVRDFKDANKDQIVAGMKAGPRGATPIIKALGDAWLESPDRRRYEEVVFKPGGCEEWQYNMWQGWAVEPSEEGSWDLFKGHIQHNICRDDPIAFDYVMSWLALTVQKPDEPIGAAIALRGDKGTGKGFFVKKVGKLFGQNFMQVSSPKAVTGNFNAHLRSCVLLFADEAFCTGRQEDEAALKSLITEETIVIEAKGRDRIVCKNMLHLICSTNHDWMVPASGGAERRFCCINVGNEKQQNTEYFDAIDEQLEVGGYGRMLWDLLHADVSGFNPQRIPSTDELTEQKIRNLPPEGHWWFSRLSDGASWKNCETWKPAVACSAMHDDYIAYCQVVRVPGHEILGSSQALGKRLAKMIWGENSEEKIKTILKKARPGEYGPKEYDESITLDSNGRAIAVNKRLWIIPPLEECRNGFNKWQRVKINWEVLSTEDSDKSEVIVPENDESNLDF